MSWGSPGEETDKAILEDKDGPDPVNNRSQPRFRLLVEELERST